MLRNSARRVAELMGRDSPAIRALRPFYESLLDLTTGGRGIPWTINGSEYRIDPRYRHQMGASYDAHLAEWLSARVRPGHVTLDVGANVGIYVLQFARWSAPGGLVIALEPNPRARSVLEKHIRLNGIASRVEVIAAAAGSSAGEAPLFAAEADGMSRLGAPNPALGDRAEPVSVPVVALDDLCAARGIEPDWLFLDIEGFEIAALEGARQTLGRVRGGLGVVVEMHPDVWEISGTSRQSAEDLLHELGLRAEGLSAQKDPLAEHGHVVLRPA